MKHIQQKHSTDCGIASVAMLGGISYEKALKLVLPDRKKGMWYTATLRQLADAVIKLGYQANLLFGKEETITSLTQNAIVLLTNEQAYTTHAVVWDAKKKRILDPLLVGEFDPKTGYVLTPSGKRVRYREDYSAPFHSAIVIK